MYEKLKKWIDEYLSGVFPKEVVAVVFNLYEDTDDNWSLEIVGTGNFDSEDDDWACDEITDFGTREDLFSWEESVGWEDILSEITDHLLKYLEEGKYSAKLKSLQGVGVGFVDGDIEILFSK